MLGSDLHLLQLTSDRGPVHTLPALCVLTSQGWEDQVY